MHLSGISSAQHVTSFVLLENHPYFSQIIVFEHPIKFDEQYHERMLMGERNVMRCDAFAATVNLAW